MKPNIELEIEEIVLHGFPPGAPARISKAVESELLRLLTEHGLAPSLHTRGAPPCVRADAIRMTSADNPDELGRGIARAVYVGIGPASTTTRQTPGGDE